MDPGRRFTDARDFLIAKRTDYSAAHAGFRWPVLERFNWALDYFDVHAQDNDRLALWVVDESGAETRRTFAELSRRSNQVANFLRQCGVRRGHCILVMLPNVAPLWEITLAALKLGAVLSPASTLLTGADLQDRIQRGNVRHVITETSGTARFRDVAGAYTRCVVGGSAPGWTDYANADLASVHFTTDGDTAADDPFLLYFTSGTTAKPKMALHTHQSYPVGHLSTMYWIGLQAGDVHWNISSPGWAKHAWSSFFAPWNAGATVFVHNAARFDAKTALSVLARHPITTMCAPPTVWRLLILEDMQSHHVSLRELVSAGEPLNPEVIERVKEAWGLSIRDGYGQTESTAMIGNSPGQTVKPGSMGRPLPGYRMSLLDPDVLESSEGEIAVHLDPRPTGLMHRYVDNPERSAELLAGRYFRTSDIASRDADGYFWYVGRADDVFKSADYRISPFEIESALIEHEAVAEAAVVPSPDPVRLSVPKAFVVLKPGVAPSREIALSILRFLRNRLAPYQRVRRIEFADLPKTISGKIRRVELRVAENTRAAQSRGPLEFWEQDFPELV